MTYPVKRKSQPFFRQSSANTEDTPLRVAVLRSASGEQNDVTGSNPQPSGSPRTWNHNNNNDNAKLVKERSSC